MLVCTALLNCAYQGGAPFGKGALAWALSMAASSEAQQIAILGVAAIVACLPETAKISEERLTAALALMAHGRSKDFTEKLARFIAMGVATAREVPDVVEKIKAHKATKN